MKKLLVLAIAVLAVIILMSSCSGYTVCPTYSNSSMKQYGPKYTFAHAKVSAKKPKKNKIW